MSMHSERSAAAPVDAAADAATVAGPGDILALVTSTSPWSAAAVAGVALAARWSSNLTGCFVDPSTRMLRDADGEPTVLGLLMEPRADHADAYAHAAFGELARHSGVREANWAVSSAGVAQTLRHLGAWHDLALIERDMVEASGLLDTIGEAILGSQLPCLILPPHWTGKPSFEYVVIGCNGSIESIRAIHAAMPFLREGRTSDADRWRRARIHDAGGRLPHFDPFVYLLRHHITARAAIHPRLVRPRRRSPAEGGARCDRSTCW